MPRHNAAIDYLRAFIIVLVLMHHSIIAYAPYATFNPVHFLWSAPIVDSRRWAGFDPLTLFNDIYFMSLMFFISGLFVWSGLVRKGARQFLRDRLLRLGVPFLLAVTVLMPIAFYPSFRMTGADPGFLAYWWHCFTVSAWPAGPAWFIWTLLAFDTTMAAIHQFAPRIGRRFEPAASQASSHPGQLILLFLAASGIVYLCLLLAFGRDKWFSYGPFSIQASRVLFYFTYFAAGVGIGAVGIEHGLLANGGWLQLRWARWLRAGLAGFAVIVLFEVEKAERGADWPLLAWEAGFAVIFACACAAMSLAMLALFLRFANRPIPLFEALHGNAYGIYLTHYIFIIWLQYSLLDLSLPAPAKAAIVFSGTLCLSWSLIALLRRIPIVARII